MAHGHLGGRRRSLGALVIAALSVTIATAGCDDDRWVPAPQPVNLDFSGDWSIRSGAHACTLVQLGGTLTGTIDLPIEAVGDRFTLVGWVAGGSAGWSLVAPPETASPCSGCTLPETRCLAARTDDTGRALEISCVQEPFRCCGTHLEVEYTMLRDSSGTPSR